MAGWSDWYSGSMAPPLALPGGGYAPAPAVQAPMSVEELYRGIYGSSAPSLSSVSRPTVPINPQTGMPYMTTASAKGGAGVGHGYAASGSATYAAPRTPAQANPVPGIRDLGIPQYGLPGAGGGVLTKSGLPPGATVDKTYTAPLVPKPLVAGSARGSAKTGAGGFGSGSLTLPPRASASSSDVITLAFDPMSDTSGQNMANSSGKPVRGPGPNSKTYYPTNGATDKVRAPMRPVGNPPAVPGGQRQGGGLLSLFGGNGGGGGLLAGLFGGGNTAPPPSAYGNSPSQGQAMIVNPGTSAGQTLSSMGFSDGAAVPAATIRNLESRGYFN